MPLEAPVAALLWPRDLLLQPETTTLSTAPQDLPLQSLGSSSLRTEQHKRMAKCTEFPPQALGFPSFPGPSWAACIFLTQEETGGAVPRPGKELYVFVLAWKGRINQFKTKPSHLPSRMTFLPSGEASFFYGAWRLPLSVICKALTIR